MAETIQMIAVDRVLHPEDQQRIDIDEARLEELRESIRDHGLINPITVRKTVLGYELIAGSRRLKCHELLNLPLIKAIVLDVDELEADILRAHENEFRHDPNPVESGIYINRLQEKHHMTASEIAKQLNKSEGYVRARIELMTYPEYILEHVATGKLSIGAAGHLAAIEPDVKRQQYVRWAVWRGITAAQAAAWKAHAALGNNAQTPEQLPQAPQGSEKQEYRMLADCKICGRNDDVQNLGMFYAHDTCIKGEATAHAVQESQNETTH